VLNFQMTKPLLLQLHLCNLICLNQWLAVLQWWRMRQQPWQFIYSN